MSAGGTRAAAMADSVARVATSAGLEPDDRLRLARALSLAMTPRMAALDDDHHPAYLHPGRTVVLLLRDVGVVGTDALCAAALAETEDDALRVGPDDLAALPAGVARALDAIPRPGAQDLEERLIGLEHDVAVAALAERLDHLRHYHLRPDLEGTWSDRHAEVARVWAPVAERVDATLARRYAHWLRTFRKRL